MIVTGCSAVEGNVMGKVPKADTAVDATKESRLRELQERKRLLEQAIADLEALATVRARTAPVSETVHDKQTKPSSGDT